MRRAGWGWRGGVAGFGLRDRLAAAVSGTGADRDREVGARRPAARSKARSRRAIRTTAPGRPPSPRRPAGRPRSATAPWRQPLPRSAAMRRARASRSYCRPARPISYFTLADPYRLIVDMPDVSFQLAQGLGPAGARPDPGLSLRPVRARQVAHRHRYQGAGADRAGGHGEPAGLAAARLNIDLVPTDRASFLTKLPPPAPRPKEARGHDQDDLSAPKAACQAGHRHRCGAWRGRSRGGQRRGAREGRRAVRRPASAHHPGREGPL